MCLISLFYGNLFSVKFAIFKSFCLKDIMLGITDEEDLFINHILLIAKKHIYFFLKHFSGPESGILEFDWLLTRVQPVQFFPIRTPRTDRSNPRENLK